MPEYLGYKTHGQGIIDWSGATARLNEQINQAIGTRQREREAFAEIEQANVDSINSHELGRNQTFNEFILKGSDNIRNQMYEWSQAAKKGEMTRADFKARMNNVSSDWTAFSNAAKNFDKRHEEILERGRTGKGSVFEAEFNKHNAMLANLGGRMIYVNPTTGRLYNSELAEDGTISNATAAHQLMMPGNLLDDSLNLAESVKGHVDTFGEWQKFEELGRGATRTTKSKRLMEEYEVLIESSIDTFVTNPRDIAKILVDNGQGEFYWSPEELKSKIDAKVKRQRDIKKKVGTLELWDEAEYRAELEKNYVFIGEDETGTFQPIPTEEQEQLARDRVRQEFDKQTGVEVSGKGAWKPTSSSISAGDESSRLDLMRRLHQAWSMSETDRNQSQAILSSLTGDNTYFKWTEGGLQAYVSGGTYKDNEGATRLLEKPIGSPVKSLQDLSSYFYPETDAKGQAIGYSQFIQDLQKVRGEKRSSQTYTIEGTSYTKKELLSAGWTEEQIRQL